MISKMYYYILVIKKYIYVSPQENLFNIGGEYFLLNRFYESFIYIYKFSKIYYYTLVIKKYIYVSPQENLFTIL